MILPSSSFHLSHVILPFSGSDGVWIELTYSGGSKYNSHCGKMARTARIVFLCDPNIAGMVWKLLYVMEIDPSSL